MDRRPHAPREERGLTRSVRSTIHPLVPKLLFGNALPRNSVSPAVKTKRSFENHPFPNRSLGTREHGSWIGHLQQPARLFVAVGLAAVLAGRHPGQADQLPPAERRPRRRELLGY